MQARLRQALVDFCLRGSPKCMAARRDPRTKQRSVVRGGGLTPNQDGPELRSEEGAEFCDTPWCSERPGPRVGSLGQEGTDWGPGTGPCL